MTDEKIQEILDGKEKDKWFILGTIIASIAATGAFLYTEIHEDDINRHKFQQEFVISTAKLMLEREIKVRQQLIKESAEQRAIFQQFQYLQKQAQK